MLPELHQSNLRDLEECPARFDLKRQGKTGYEVPLFEAGLRLHGIWYTYVDHCQQAGVPRDDEYADLLEQEQGESRYAAACRKLPLTVILRPGYYVQMEHEFAVPLVNCVFAGRLDRLEYNPDAKQWRIIDYKSGFKPERPDRVPRQLLLYAAAIDHLFGKDGDTYECWLQYPEANPNFPPCEWTLNQDVLEGVMGRVDSLALDLDKRTRWDPTPGTHCRACPFLCADCPLNGQEAMVVNCQEEALFAWQQQQHLAAAVKDYIADHGPVEGIGGWGPPKWVETGEQHWTLAGKPNSKVRRENMRALVTVLNRLGATHPDLVDYGKAFSYSDAWLNRVMRENGLVAEAVRHLVQEVAPKAVFQQ